MVKKKQTYSSALTNGFLQGVLLNCLHLVQNAHRLRSATFSAVVRFARLVAPDWLVEPFPARRCFCLAPLLAGG